jgi:hypothetical protein
MLMFHVPARCRRSSKRLKRKRTFTNAKELLWKKQRVRY